MYGRLTGSTGDSGKQERFLGSLDNDLGFVIPIKEDLEKTVKLELVKRGKF